jgi:hypothetical protein
MTVTYNPKTKRYETTNKRKDHFPEQKTLQNAIQNAITITFYWHNLNK